MRSLTLVAVTLFSVGCSSAGDLPLGGPYGGLMNPDASASDTDSGIVFTVGSGSGTSSSSGTIIVVGSSSSTTSTIGTTSTSTTSTNESSTGESSTTTSSSHATSTSTSTSTSSSTASSSSTSSAPTWTELYTGYLAVGTPGDCDGSCHHHSQCSSASACYSWIGGGKYDLSSNGDLLCWDSNGFMPTNCPSSVGNAVADFAAWIAAGSQNN